MDSPVALLGNDARVLRALDLLQRVADSDATVLIRGETGTGKELAARILHERGRRRREPFVAVNCGAVPETLLEAELFGSVKGAYTGATASRIGRFEAADRGTIFLDEVATMSGAMQVALLRVLQSGEFSPVGSARPSFCHARVVAATNVDLRELVAAGRFRSDLYYRLNVIQLELPPLRDRPGDIALLAHHFLQRYAEHYGKPLVELSPAALEVMLAHPFPGNVRELENLIHRAVLLTRSMVLTVDDFPDEVSLPVHGQAGPPSVSGFHAVKANLVARFEREFLTASLDRAGGVITEAARQSGLSERVFHVKLRKYGIRGRLSPRSVPPDG